jgi:hypothetical protein
MEFKRITRLGMNGGFGINGTLLGKLVDALEEVDNFPSRNVLTEGKEDIDNLNRQVTIHASMIEQYYLEIVDWDKRDARLHHPNYFAKNISFKDEESLKRKYGLIL